MKFSSVCFALLAATSADAFRPLAVSPRAATFLQQSSSTEERALSKKEERLRMMKSPQFYRQGFKEVREGVEKSMEEQFKGDIVQQLRESNYIMERDGVKVYLAKDFGFCWGVERSIALAYEAVEHYPGKTVHITNELIHNPEVNEKLEDMNVQFIEKREGGQKNFDTVKEGDVVILPAFGASFEEMDRFDKMVSFFFH
jgi:4-hydroxy-3-methylbut-2-enyl diphosphate reductase